MKLDYPISAQHPLVTQLLQMLGRGVNNYFTQPTVQSPIPQKQFPTQFQQNMQQVQNALVPTAYAPIKRVPPPTIPQPAQQVMAAQTDPFSDFTTSKVPPQYAQLIAQSAQANGVPPAVLASLLFSEHGFQPTGTNYNRDQNGNIIPGNYDRGMAQINKLAHPEVTDQQANDPNFAIPWAAKTLGGHIKNLGVQRGIIAYNTGASGAADVKDPTQHPYYKKVANGVSKGLRSKLGL